MTNKDTLRALKKLNRPQYKRITQMGFQEFIWKSCIVLLGTTTLAAPIGKVIQEHLSKLKLLSFRWTATDLWMATMAGITTLTSHLVEQAIPKDRDHLLRDRWI